MRLVALALLPVWMIACTTVLGDDFVIVLEHNGQGGDVTATSSSQGGAGTTASVGTGGSGVGTRCDAALQDCPNGLKCAPWDPPPGHCIENGTLPEGSACASTHPNSDVDDCAAGLLCIASVCRPICDPSEPTCGNGQAACLLFVGGLGVCLPWCDPLAQNCGNAEGCYPEIRSMGFICAPNRTHDPEDAPCMFLNECESGLTCVTPPSCPNGCCQRYCDLSQPMCNGGDTCVSLGAAPPYTHVGICLPP